MAFDKSKPVNGELADADLVRNNFNSLAVHHRGSTAPANPDVGYIWLDDSNSNNNQLKLYAAASGGSPRWVPLMSHLETDPVAQNAPSNMFVFVMDENHSTGSSYYVFQFAAMPVINDSRWTRIYNSAFMPYLEILADSVTSETTIDIMDPGNVINTVAFATIPIPAYFHGYVGVRGIVYTVTGNIGTAQLSWKWNDVFVVVKVTNSPPT